MSYGEKWTQVDVQYLEENWGNFSLKTLAKNLERSEASILNKVQRLGLGAFLDNGDYVSWNQFLIALGEQSGSGYKNISWIQNKGFPIRNKKVKNNSFKVVNLDEFWKWADENRSFLDFSKFEENTLGLEPEWAKEKRKHDIEKNRKYIRTPWTKIEEERLKKLLKDFKYTYDDLSRMLRRTNGVIQRRICDLGLKERPVKADNHIKWSESEKTLLQEMIGNGYSYEYMSEKIGRSAKAIRGRVGAFYGTENLDKVRVKMKKLVRREVEIRAVF